MKALRYFLLSLLATFSFAASAQTIEVYKDGRVIDSFSATQVDSVVYAPAAAQPRYYYYAGWDCPTSVEGTEETSLVNLIETEYPVSNVVGETQFAKAGGEADVSKTIINGEIGKTIKLCYGNKTDISNYKNEHGNYPLAYIAMPNEYSVYQSGVAIVREHHPIDDSHYYIEFGNVWSIANITISK